MGETMNQHTILINSITQELEKQLFIEVEASGRHIHLSRQHVEALFTQHYSLTPIKDLSQPGQFVCKERLTIKGPKGVIEGVVVLGPEREHSQVEVSLTDANILGLKPPIRLSGDIALSPGITIMNPDNGKKIYLEEGLIVAKRHIHMTPQSAEKFQVKDGEVVKVKVFGKRPLIFDDVDVRVSKKYSTYMHIDYDEANACGYQNKTMGMIIGKNLDKHSVPALSDIDRENSSAKGQYKGNLLRESQVKDMGLTSGDHLNLSPKCIITPLAMDYVLVHGIKIIRE